VFVLPKSQQESTFNFFLHIRSIILRINACMLQKVWQIGGGMVVAVGYALVINMKWQQKKKYGQFLLFWFFVVSSIFSINSYCTWSNRCIISSNLPEPSKMGGSFKMAVAQLRRSTWQIA